MSGKMTDKEFTSVLSVGNVVAKKMRHKYNIPYDTSQSYIVDIISKEYDKVTDLIRSDSKGRLNLFFTDKLRSREYCAIEKVKILDTNQYKHKVFVNVELSEPINPHDLLYYVSNSVSTIFSIEKSDVFDKDKKGYRNNLLTLLFYGRASPQFSIQEDLEIEFERLINEFDNVKVLDSYSSYVDRFYQSIYHNIGNIDFTDDYFEVADKKELFYEYLDEFCLTENEKTFVNLVFKGYHPNDDSDIEFFIDSMKTDDGSKLSAGYIRNRFFGKLCKKLRAKSPFLNDYSLLTRFA